MFWFLRGNERGSKPKSNSKQPKRRSGALVSRANASSRAQETFETVSHLGREVLVHRKPYRRSLGLTLQVSGRIKVTAPKSTPLHFIQDFLNRNSLWIEKNLDKYKSLRDAHPPKRYVAGEAFPYLGRKITLRFEVSESSKFDCSVSGDELVVRVPRSQSRLPVDSVSERPELGPVISGLYESEGRRILSRRLAHYSDLMGLQPKALSFRAQKTRWGSCTAKGKISLNWRLVIAPLDVIDYVVIHELSHLAHYDHSPAFWRLVATQSPEWPKYRNWLRSNQYEADFLAKSSELHG